MDPRGTVRLVLREILVACGLLFVYSQVFSVFVFLWSWAVMERRAFPGNSLGIVTMRLAGIVPFAFSAALVGALAAYSFDSKRRWAWAAPIAGVIGLAEFAAERRSGDAPIWLDFGLALLLVAACMGGFAVFSILAKRRSNGPARSA
jgi:hypothetical protein